MIDLFHQVPKMLGPAVGPRDPRHPGWPEATGFVRLAGGWRVRLRPLTARDGVAWRHQRIRDEAWLRPVEPTQRGSWRDAHSAAAWRYSFKNLRDYARQGIVVPLVIELDGRFAGQVTIGNIQHGAISEAWIGYWVHSAFMGRGLGTVACALGVDHAFRRVGLHRLTATYLPSNPASGQVLAHCGFREEGYLRRNLHIDGRWQDHHFVALLVDDMPETCVELMIRQGRCSAWR